MNNWSRDSLVSFAPLKKVTRMEGHSRNNSENVREKKRSPRKKLLRSANYRVERRELEFN